MDQHNSFASMYGLRAVPFGIYVDEDGRIVKPPHNISVSDPAALRELEDWIDGKPISFEVPPASRGSQGPKANEADLRFRLGTLLLSQGRRDDALAEWRRAIELDPTNWIIHKQLWAVEHPDAFYEGAVDYAWQKKQLQREERRTGD